MGVLASHAHMDAEVLISPTSAFFISANVTLPDPVKFRACITSSTSSSVKSGFISLISLETFSLSKRPTCFSSAAAKASSGSSYGKFLRILTTIAFLNSLRKYNSFKESCTLVEDAKAYEIANLGVLVRCSPP